MKKTTTRRVSDSEANVGNIPIEGGPNPIFPLFRPVSGLYRWSDLIEPPIVNEPILARQNPVGPEEARLKQR